MLSEYSYITIQLCTVTMSSLYNTAWTIYIACVHCSCYSCSFTLFFFFFLLSALDNYAKPNAVAIIMHVDSGDRGIQIINNEASVGCPCTNLLCMVVDNFGENIKM